MSHAARVLLAIAAVLTMSGVAFGGQTGRARLIATAVDPERAVLPGATVTITGADEATGRSVVAPVVANGQGQAQFDNLTPGRYTVSVSLSGFESGLLRDVLLKVGDNRHVVVLSIRRITESVTVGAGQEGASSRTSATFGAAMAREAIDTLSDDPTELQRQLMEMAGADAVIRVDTFEGGQLPPKSQIKSVHVTRDQFAAEADYPGTTFVDVVTQPGTGALSGQVSASSRTMALAGRSPFVGTAPAERNRSYNGTIGGTLIRGKSDFSVSVQGQDQSATPIFRQAGRPGELLGVEQPTWFVVMNSLLNYELPRNQTFRFGYARAERRQRNQGVGQYDAPERAFDTEYGGFRFLLQEAGPLGRRSFLNSRLQVTTTEEIRTSKLEAPTIVIQGERTTGGAQMAGKTKLTDFRFASDLDYVRGIHSWRTGVQVFGGLFDTNSSSNYLGTYVFANQAAFQAGKPLQYTRNIGDPRVRYLNAVTAVYLQDDIRVRKSLTFSPGVRYMVQTHVKDYSGVAPRFGTTWAPFASGRTTLRASVGLFYWPMETTGVYEQTLRLDGQHQQEALIVNPSYPNPGPVAGLPANKYILGNYRVQRNIRYSVGVEQSLSPRVRASLLYAYTRQFQLWRGENLNPLVNGVRPDPAFANVVAAVTDGHLLRHDVNANLNVSMVAPSAAGTARLNWRRLSVAAGYSMLYGRQDSEGAFAVPPSGRLDTEWGRMPADSPYRVNIAVTSTQLRNLNASVSWTANAGSPYTLTTGVDDNQDGILNDRPLGVPLRSLRSPGQSTVNLRMAYTLNVGQAAWRRYRISLTLNATNLGNRDNFGGYSGNMLSPDFLQPTFVINPRRIDFGTTLGF